ncbi:Acg family FMN-binding oxidoreductase [Mycobacterium sp. LTG2003]
MTTRLPDAETVQTALSLAVRAPSVHNSQPWRWRVGADRLYLYADRTQHLPATDPDGRDLMLSCGATLHHCVVALAALGYRATVHRFPDPTDPDLLAMLTVGPSVPIDADLTLAAAIGRRHTDRRHYSDREVSPADIALMGARAARTGVTLRRVESFTELSRIMDEAVSHHISDREYLNELARWSGRFASRGSTGSALAQPARPATISDQGVVVALGTRDDDDLARLRAGEATSLVLLTATALGLSTCPITEPLEVAQTRAALRDEIFDCREHPQMLIRVGWSVDDADPLPDTPRRRTTWPSSR